MGNSATNLIESKLGNPFFSTDDSKDSEIGKLLSQFTLLSTYEDELFERCSVLEHKQTKELIIAKEVNCQTQLQMQSLYQQFQRRKAMLKHPNLVRLRFVLQNKTEGMFSQSFKLLLLFDYVITNLLSQYNNRVRNKTSFTPDEINIITNGGLHAYAALQGQGIANTKVRLKNIYFGLHNNQTQPKIIDAKLFPNSNNAESVRKQQEQTDVFLAPQQLKNIRNQQYYNPKSGVFSFGISLMQLCLANSSLQLYDYSKKILNTKQLETRLNIIKNKYPLSVFCLIREMVEVSDDARPSFRQLAEKLPQNIRKLPATMSLSVMKGTAGFTKSKARLPPPTGYTKLISPVPIARTERNMHSTTLASQYRPNVDASELYTNGNMFTGQKKEGVRHGKGKYVYADGSYYFGDWFKGKMEGTGQLYGTDGRLEYEGEWKNDLFEGKGVLNGRDGQSWIRYEGEFKAGKMDGFGQLVYRNANRYKGQFRADQPWGKGRLFQPNGQVQAGLWENDHFVSQF